MAKNQNRRKNIQISESFICAIFLTLSGGFQDAYTYCSRGEVFANAQTGNIVLMCSYLFQGKFNVALRYFIPIFSFISGIFLAELFHRRFKTIKFMHWRQIILITEILLLFIVAFVPQNLNNLANAMVSFVCAMQVQTFRKIKGNVYASTMCIGNLRNGTEAFCSYFHTKDKNDLRTSGRYFAVIALFASGAGVGYILTLKLGIHAILLSCVLLTVSFFMMFIKEK